MIIKIDKNVPLPTGSGRGAPPTKYPIGDMEVGDSFFVVEKTSGSFGGVLERHRKSGKSFTVRSLVENGVSGARIWRTK